MIRRALQHDVVIIACAISAGIHGALTPAHFAEGVGAGAGFLAATIVLALLVVALTLRPASIVALGATVAALGALLAAYAAAVTTGLPLVHPEAEPVDGLAVVTKAVELGGLLAAVSVPFPRLRGALA